MSIKKRHLWIIEELKELKTKGLISKPRARSNKGYANFPIKWSIEGYFKNYALKERGIKNRAFASYDLGNDYGGIILIDFENREKGKNAELQKVLDNSEYVNYRKKMTDIFAQKLLEFSTDVITFENCKNASKKQLIEWYDIFRDFYTRFEFYNAIWFIVGEDVAQIVVDRLQNKGCGFEEIQILMTPVFQSFVNRESIALFDAAIEISQNSKAAELIVNNDFDSFSKLKEFKLLEKLTMDFHWVPWLHVGPDLYNELHYFNELKSLIDKHDLKDLKKELLRSKNFYKNISQKQKKLIEKYSINKDTVRLLKNIHMFSQLQDERKEYIAKTHIPWIKNLMTVIGSFFGKTAREAADIYPEKIYLCLIKDKIDVDDTIVVDDTIDIDDTKKNKKNKKSIKDIGSFSVTDPRGYTKYKGGDAKIFLDIIQFEENNDELKGTCASVGTARGRVKVMHNSDEINKMNEGDILVTTMTTPDFVPAMRKASGIITNEGGITCHAAIVSREFGIPCIIGTRNATEILNDNDLIEMNANKGTITIIEKNSEKN